MPNIPNQQDAELFAKSIKKWQEVLNLGDWRIEKGTKPAKQAMASVEFNENARLAVYRLGDFGAEKITDESLDKTALHECLANHPHRCDLCLYSWRAVMERQPTHGYCVCRLRLFECGSLLTG